MKTIKLSVKLELLFSILILVIAGCVPSTPETVESVPGMAEGGNQAFSGKKVLFVNSYHKGYPWSDGIETGLHTVFDDTDITLKIIHLDTKNNPSEEFAKEAALKAKTEIEAFTPDIVIAADDNAQKYLVVPYLKNSDFPIIFAGVNWDASAYGYPTNNITGMIEVELPDQLVGLIKPYAEGDHIGYLTIDTETERKVVEIYNQRFFGGQMQTYWATTQDEFKDKFIAAQQEIDILFIGNNAGSDKWDEMEMKNFLQTNTKVPTGSINDWMAPYSLLTLAKSAEEQGEWAARTALSFLDGTPLSQIPVTENKKGKIIVNLDIANQLGVVFAPSLLKNAEIIDDN